MHIALHLKSTKTASSDWLHLKGSSIIDALRRPKGKRLLAQHYRHSRSFSTVYRYFLRIWYQRYVYRKVHRIYIDIDHITTFDAHSTKMWNEYPA
jgi:hypothetical protein